MQERVKEVFEYRRGDLYYRKQPQGRRTELSIPAGTVGSDGYRSIRLDGKSWKAHRLIWIYHYGGVPSMLDHIDRNRLNNDIRNLRLVEKRQNLRNSRGYGKHSKYKGVHPTKTGWCGRICISDSPKRTDITKSFPTEIEAALWYNSVAKEWWGDYAYLNKIGGLDELQV